MSQYVLLSSVVITPFSALFMFASVLIGGDHAYAEPLPASTEPAAPLPVKPPLDAIDHDAALDAVRIALTEAGDGSTYVWQRHHGRLNGSIRMTRTFRSSDGRLCRHLVMTMTAGRYTRKTEGVACRDRDRVWSLEG